MKRSSINSALFILSSILLSPLSTQAHDTWLARIHGEQTVMYGHHESINDSYDPAKITDARAFKNGQSEAVRIVPHEQRYATLEADNPGLLGYTMNGGFWYKTKEGKWHNQPKDTATATVETAIRSYKYSVSYLNDREVPRALGYDLEIVPTVNPAKLKKGDKLTVQVLHKGKPLPAAKLNSNIFGEGEKVTADADGRAEISVARNGLNTLGVNYATEYEDKTKADKLSLSATLSFRARRE